MKPGALLIGIVIAMQGIFGIAAPEAFVSTLRFIQMPPVIYAAAVIRVAFGMVLFRAAPASRTPRILRALGFVIVIGGVLTPFFGVRIGLAILDWWSAGGAPFIRMGAGVSLALGAFIVYSIASNDTRRLTAGVGGS